MSRNCSSPNVLESSSKCPEHHPVIMSETSSKCGAIASMITPPKGGNVGEGEEIEEDVEEFAKLGEFSIAAQLGEVGEAPIESILGVE
ncbi:hypothetical protein GW17_00033264 [Ensete ventricosum]|nr:hypothetical protein GW17_00033264 [Ensete ventricosum]RZS12737.1 hypothetical protein BHM03_00044226 [Ensete ventricosum]